VLASYDRILKARGGVAVAAVSAAAICGGCRVGIRPQAIQELARGDRAHGLRELRALPLLAGLTLLDVTLYTDGACSGNPGPGGLAALLVEDGAERIVSGAEPHTTKSTDGAEAAIEGLAAVADRRTVHLFTDSSYVMNCFRDRWWTRWEANAGWAPASSRSPT